MRQTISHFCTVRAALLSTFGPRATGRRLPTQVVHPLCCCLFTSSGGAPGKMPSSSTAEHGYVCGTLDHGASSHIPLSPTRVAVHATHINTTFKPRRATVLRSRHRLVWPARGATKLLCLSWARDLVHKAVTLFLNV